MDDPVTCWLFPDSERRRRMATRFFTWTLETVSMPLGEVWTVDDCRVVALWNPPYRWKFGPLDQVRLLPKALSLFRGQDTLNTPRLQSARVQAPDAPPHWYLYFIGTRPELQGHGLGVALLADMLDRADDEGRARVPRGVHPAGRSLSTAATASKSSKSSRSRTVPTGRSCGATRG